MTDRAGVWTLQFAAAVDDLEGQVHTVGALCRARDIQCAEEWTGATCSLLLASVTEEAQVEQIVIDASRAGCPVVAVRRQGE